MWPFKFSEKEIEGLIKLVKESKIEELEICRWGQKIRITKSTVIEPIKTKKVTTKRAEPTVILKSNMVGTLHLSLGENKDPFVKIGSKISPENDILCIIEAMKLMNEITVQDTVGGENINVPVEITEILLEDGKPVEWGQNLFIVRLLPPTS